MENLDFLQFTLPIPAQLPWPIETLVNQKHVLSALDDVLAGLAEAPRIVVLLGARGSGKSTVGVRWLADHSDRFPDGQLHADLGAWSDHAAAPAEVLSRFLTSLGVDRADVPADLDSRARLFRSLTKGRSYQILLDDAVTAAQVKPLLPGPGRSLVIVTGQGGLGALADHGAVFVDVEPLQDDMAAELLRVWAGSRVDAEPAARDSVVELCSGRAVALSVVGRIMSEAPELALSELLEELESGGLTSVTIDGEPEIAAVLDAGYRRLSEQAQRAYRTLGLHPGADGVSPHALAAALNVPELQLRAVVRELVHGKRMADQIDGRLRLELLVRDHARTTALAVDGADVCEMRKRAFVRWYAKGALAADSVLQPLRPWARELFGEADTAHPAHGQAREWMLAERGALRSAVELAAELGELEAVLRLCVAQWWLYESEKFADDVLVTHKIGIEAAEHIGRPVVQALLLVQQGFALRTLERFPDAVESLSKAAAVAGDHLALEATAIEGAGLARFEQRELVAAQELLARNLELARRIGDPRRVALACLHAAKPAEPANAARLLAEARSGFLSLEQPDRHNLAKVALWQGIKLDDRARLQEALALMTELGRDYDRAQILEALGDVEAAAQLYESTGHLLAAARLMPPSAD